MFPLRSSAPEGEEDAFRKRTASNDTATTAASGSDLEKVDDTPKLRPLQTFFAPYLQGLGSTLESVGATVTEWCKDHPRFYSEDFLRHRRHPKVKINHFMGTSLVGWRWITSWGCRW